MSRKWFLFGAFSYLFVTAIVFPFVLKVPVGDAFSSDAIAYSEAAINLLRHGFLSLDNIHPYLMHEPGMSLFLAAIYVVFGVENPTGLYLVQGFLLLAGAYLFSRELSKITSARAGGICFFLILVSGSVLHAAFMAYRECLALILLLFFSAMYRSNREKPIWWITAGEGLLFGGVILTYYSFIFFAPVFLVLVYLERRPFVPMLAAVLLCYAVVAGYAFRNFSYDGRFRVIDGSRTNIMWYVRGEQAQSIRGAEPFWCLWAEYVSRDWSGRSPQCSFNALMHKRWPPGHDSLADFQAAGVSGREKIRQYFGWYLWFSAFEVMELHIPFVGAGWTHAFNLYAVLTGILMYAGFIIGLRRIFDRRFIFFALIILYHMGVFVLTDATPRYLVPVLFCYAVFAAIGYDSLLNHFNRS